MQREREGGRAASVRRVSHVQTLPAAAELLEQLPHRGWRQNPPGSGSGPLVFIKVFVFSEVHAAVGSTLQEEERRLTRLHQVRNLWMTHFYYLILRDDRTVTEPKEHRVSSVLWVLSHFGLLLQQLGQQ